MTPSAVRSEHIIACAAYIVALPVLEVVIGKIGIFDFIFNSIDISGYTIFDFWTLRQRLPDGLTNDQIAFLNLCHVGAPACAVGTFAEAFTALAIVWRVVPLLIEGPTFAAAAHPRASRFVNFVTCLALVVIVGRYVVSNLHDLIFHASDTGLTYVQKWQHLPGATFAWHLSELVAACLATRHSIRIREWRDPSTLFESVLAGNAQAVLEQVSAGADPNSVRDEDGATPLHVAVRAAQPEVVTILLANKAEPQLRDQSGATPLHLAAAAGDVDSINALLDAGADPGAYDGDSGRTPVSYAEENAHPQAIAALRARMDQPVGGEDQ